VEFDSLLPAYYKVLAITPLEFISMSHVRQTDSHAYL